MNFESFKTDFLSFIQEKLTKSSNNSKIGERSSSNISIFSQGDMLKEYLNSEGNIDSSIFTEDISNIENTGIKNEFLNGAISELLNNESIFNAADTNGDGILSEEENLALLQHLGGLDANLNNLSLEELLTAFQDAENGKFKIPENENTENAENSEKSGGAKETESSSGSNSSSSGTHSPSSNSTRKSSSTDNSSDDKENSSKNIENMSLDELEKEKNTRESNVEKAQQKIEDIHNGTNSKVKAATTDAENAKTEYENMVDSLAEQEVISEDLKNQQKQNLSDIGAKETEINGINSNIRDTEGNISSKKSDISSTESNISALESALASYDNASGKDSKEKSDIESKKESLRKQIEAEKEKLEGLKADLENLEATKTTLEGNLQTAETELNGLNTEKSNIETQLLQECEMKMPALKQALSDSMLNYNQAKLNVDTVKQTELQSANSSLKTAQTELSEVNTMYDKKSASKIYGSSKYKNTEMESVVNYFGEDYLSVLSQEEIDKIIKLAKKEGVANIYDGWGSKCLQAAYQYERWAIGAKNRSNFYENPDLDTTVQKMAEVLNSGSPVVAKVNTQKGTRHFVLVIGIKEGANAPYKQSDFLCIDSYDGQVDGMGGSGNVKGNYRTLYEQEGNYWLASRQFKFKDG